MAVCLDFLFSSASAVLPVLFGAALQSDPRPSYPTALRARAVYHFGAATGRHSRLCTSLPASSVYSRLAVTARRSGLEDGWAGYARSRSAALLAPCQSCVPWLPFDRLRQRSVVYALPSRPAWLSVIVALTGLITVGLGLRRRRISGVSRLVWLPHRNACATAVHLPRHAAILRRRRTIADGLQRKRPGRQPAHRVFVVGRGFSSGCLLLLYAVPDSPWQGRRRQRQRRLLNQPGFFTSMIDGWPRLV